MISRLSIYAALFAVLATSLVFATATATASPHRVAAHNVQVVQLPAVVVTAHRIAADRAN